eukprot:jgi/Tetstr1/440418/TSEL_028752.t1
MRPARALPETRRRLAAVLPEVVWACGASQCDGDGGPTAKEISERPHPRPRGGNRGLVLTGLDTLARLHSMFHGSGPAQRGGGSAAAWTVADALFVVGAAGGAAWAPRIDATARSLQPARVRHHPAPVVEFAEQALAWRFLAFAERRMTELMRSWDNARTEALLHAGHARQRRVDDDLFAALLVGIADTVVVLVMDGEVSRAAGRLSYEEDGVQHGAPLATTSFCVAIHPEVECDNTLEATCGAARLNTDGGYLVGLSHRVWSALYPFHTSIKASVGLEIRFDKTHAYNADLDAPRREAPADIEWLELDADHGISVDNVPLGSRG